MSNSTIEELNSRNFDSCLFSILIIPTKISVQVKENITTQKDVYMFFSCNINAKRKYLTSVFKDDFSSASEWYDFFQVIKSRGVKVLLYAVIPDNSFLSKALKLTFCEVNIFISCFEAVYKLSKYYSYSYSKSITAKVRKVFLSPTIQDYEIVLDQFIEEYASYKFVYDILESDLKRAKKYYDVDFKLRNFIFSFYFVRDISKRISSISHSKPYFNSIDELIIPLIPYIQTMEARMFCPKAELNLVINYIYADKKELIFPYL